VPIALLDTGVSALQINDYLPAGPASGGVKPNQAAFDLKPSVHGVQGGPQGELHRAPGSVNRDLLNGRNGLVGSKQRKTDAQRKNYDNPASHDFSFSEVPGSSQQQVGNSSEIREFHRV